MKLDEVARLDDVNTVELGKDAKIMEGDSQFVSNFLDVHPGHIGIGAGNSEVIDLTEKENVFALVDLGIQRLLVDTGFETEINQEFGDVLVPKARRLRMSLERMVDRENGTTW